MITENSACVWVLNNEYLQFVQYPQSIKDIITSKYDSTVMFNVDGYDFIFHSFIFPNEVTVNNRTKTVLVNLPGSDKEKDHNLIKYPLQIKDSLEKALVLFFEKINL